MKKVETITIKAYQAKCEFCGLLFTELKPHLTEQGRNEHTLKNCQVLQYICVAKDIQYPIQGENL